MKLLTKELINKFPRLFSTGDLEAHQIKILTKLLAQQLLRTCKEKNIPIFYMRMENQKFCLFSEKITPNYFDH